MVKVNQQFKKYFGTESKIQISEILRKRIFNLQSANKKESH